MVNSRTKGHSYERSTVNTYKELGRKDAVTSRAESKNRDDQGVDLCNTEPFNIQCKCYTRYGLTQAIEVLKTMPKEAGRYNIMHAKIKNKGEVVVVPIEDWKRLAKLYRELTEECITIKKQTKQ